MSPSTDQLPWSPIEVFQVNITPDMADSYEDSSRHTRQLRIGKAVRDYAKAFAESYKRRAQYYDKIKSAPNLFTIVIGVYDSIHKGSDLVDKDGQVFEGSDLDYESLFDILQNGISGKNYDPLKIIRNAHSKIEREIEECVIKLYKSSASSYSARLTKTKFKDALRTIAQKHYDEVCDYIQGGDAPPLANRTIDYYRPMKGVRGTTPLVSSGQLLNAMTFKVYVEQTQAFAVHAKTYSDELKRIGRVERNKIAAKLVRRAKGATRRANDIDHIEKHSAEAAKEISVQRRYRPQELEQEDAIALAIHRNKTLVKNILLHRQRFLDMQNNLLEEHGTNTEKWPWKTQMAYIAEKNKLAARQKEYLAAMEFLSTHGHEESGR